MTTTLQEIADSISTKLEIDAEEFDDKISLQPDFFGEVNPRLSVLVHDASGEWKAQLRFDATGNLVEIWTSADVRVSHGNAVVATPWHIERDGQ